MRKFIYSLPIRTKVILHFTWVFLLVFLFNIIYYPTVYKEQAKIGLENHVRNAGEMIALSAGISLDSLDFQGLGIAVDWAKKDSRLVYLGIFDPQNEKIAVFNPSEMDFELEKFISKREIFEFDNKIYISTPIKNKNKQLGNLVLSYSLKSLQDNIFNYQLKTFYISFGIFSFGILLLMLFLNKNIKPLLKLAEAANEVSKGNTKVNIPISSGDEIGQLAGSFNQMVEDVNHSISDLENTKKELLTAKLVAESSNQAKSLFLANMSHEIRTPMNAILGYTQLLMLNKNFTDKQKQELATINSSGNNLLALINSVLDISKIEAGKTELNKKSFDLGELIRGLRSMFNLRCQEKKLILNVYGTVDEPILVEGDETKLRQILINLLGNAVKFTEKGEISLSLENDESEYYTFKVKDTGTGISKDAQDFIYEPFVQHTEGKKYGGTGLGLTISKNFIELMGGKLILFTQVGEGTEFQFTIKLPTKNRNESRRKNRRRKTLKLASHKVVHALIVEDVIENRELLRQYLEGIGVIVEEAINGKDAIDKISQNPPDIVFSDMRMPVMNGEEMVANIKEKFGDKSIKLVLVSASVQMEKNKFYSDIGFHEFIPKPFRLEVIPACISKLLGVKFESEGNEDPEKTSGKLEENSFVLGEKSYFKLLEAAKSRNLTRLKQVIKEMENMDQNMKPLWSKLNECIGRYNTEEVLRILENVSLKAD